MPSARATIAVLLLTGLVTAEYARCARLGIGCGGRLERALEALQRENGKRGRHDEENGGSSAYQQELRSAPLEVLVSRINVKLPPETSGLVDGGDEPWARVERCLFQPNNGSLRTRLAFRNMSVSGIVSLHSRDSGHRHLGESCKMTLRLRQAGINFLTSPISRGQGQMRIRTETSFIEPRLASIYAYGCRSARFGKHIKRRDKWPPPPRHTSSVDERMPITAVHPPIEGYEAAEPRLSYGGEVNRHRSPIQAVTLANESRQPRGSLRSTRLFDAALWRKNVWITRSHERKRRWIGTDVREGLQGGRHFLVSRSPSVPRPASSERLAVLTFPLKPRIPRNVRAIAPKDFSKILTFGKSASLATAVIPINATVAMSLDRDRDRHCRFKVNSKRENHQDVPRENRELFLNDKVDDGATLSPTLYEESAKGWESNEAVAREVEDVFLRSASQALTRYIERQLHPAIKETLMLSMGYTISYG